MAIWWLVVGLAVFLIGVTKSGFGSGVGLMIVPMTVVAMNHLQAKADIALGLMLPLLIVGDFIAVWQYRRLFSLRAVLRLLPGTAIGIFIGGWLLFIFHDKSRNFVTAFIEIEIGVESIVLVALQWYRIWRMGHMHMTHPSVLRSSAVGVFAGVSSTLAHAAGPIIALHLLPQRMERQIYVGTCAIYFFVLNSAKVPVYAYDRQFHIQTFRLGLYLLPLVFVGAGFGFWITQRMNDRIFSQVVYAATFCLGWYLLWIGIQTLWEKPQGAMELPRAAYRLGTSFDGVPAPA